MSIKFLSIAIVSMVISIGLAILPESVSNFIPFRINVISNMVHIPLFAGITFASLLALHRSNPQENRSSGILIFMVLIGIAVLAGISEAIQEFIPGRSSSFYDFLLDVIGIYIGTYGVSIWKRRMFANRGKD